MNAVRLPITKTSIVNDGIKTAIRLAIPFDGIVYASILYAMDHGLKNSDTVEVFITEDTRTMFLSEFIVSHIKTQASKLNIDDITYVKRCLNQILWINDSNNVIKEYYHKRIADGIPRKISKTN